MSRCAISTGAALLALSLPAVSAAQPGEPPPVPLRAGLTFEANAGFGWIRTSPSVAPSYTSAMSLALNLGVGGWLTPQLALTGRFAGLSNLASGERLGAYFLGPSVQFWVNDRWWLGGGAGLGVLASTTSDNDAGFAFDLRLGYAFGIRPERTYSVSLEVTPTRFTADGDSATLTGFALLAGVQFL